MHRLWHHRILSERMYQRRDLRVKDQSFGGAAAVPDTPNMDTVDDGC